MDMTKGPIVRTITNLALPIMASSFLGTLYNLCDMAWVGTLGAKVVAGVGVGGMYMWFANGFATLPRMGGQVLTAQALGAGNHEKAQDYVRAALHLIFLFGLIFGVISLIFTKQMIHFFKLGDPLSESIALSYMRIACGLIVFSFLNFTLTGLYTADGDSKTPMVANLIGLILNMILDPLLIIGPGFFPRMEAVGAAVATVVSQIIVFIIMCLRMKSKRTKATVFRGLNIIKASNESSYRGIIKIGLPASVQSMVYCFISMILTRFVAGFGPEAVAVYRVGGQIESVSWNTADGFSSAINSFCGQNFGAKQYKRIRKGYFFAAATAFLWGSLVFICFMVAPGPISNVFFHEEFAIALCVSYLIVIGVSEPFMMVEIVSIGALSGLGKTQICSILSILFTGMRIPMAYFLLKTSLGVSGIWWAITVTSIIKAFIFTATFMKVKYE